MYIDQSMTFNTSYNHQPVAEAYIAKNKNRLKQHGSNVYLNNNDNFELELFNPRTNNVLCKIKINGSYIPGGGLILRPGQRYFLDRYIDVARKFVYSTYQIDGNDSKAVAAAAQNGKVEIEFYDEHIKPVTTFTVTTANSGWNQNIFYHNSNTGDFIPKGDTTVCMDGMDVGLDLSKGAEVNSYFSNTTSDAGDAKLNFLRSAVDYKSKGETLGRRFSKSSLSMQSLETGRVEKGGTSDQKFDTVDMDFNSWATNTVSWQIKPESTKPVATEDIRVYCTGCGKKLKPEHKFCSACGTKVEA